MNIQIRINLPASKAGEFREIYRNTLYVNEDCKFDYEKLIDGLNVLYPQRNKVITLNIM